MSLRRKTRLGPNLVQDKYPKSVKVASKPSAGDSIAMKDHLAGGPVTKKAGEGDSVVDMEGDEGRRGEIQRQYGSVVEMDFA